MRAIKIDSENCTITEYENTGLKSMQAAVGGLITLALDYPDGSSCFVNDEGMLNNPQVFFESIFGPNPYAGDAIIVGPTDENGDTTECTLDLGFIKKTTNFLTLFELKLMYANKE